MQKAFAQHVLLTGAGFTRNFGGLLGKDMWSKIFNNPEVQAHVRLRDLLLYDYDYESIYYQITDGDYTNQEKNSINTAIFQAYQILDDIVRKWTFRNDASYPVNIYGVNRFLERFSDRRNEIGIIFTLNQDLFLERYFSSSDTSLIPPGVPKIPNAHIIISKLPLEKRDFIVVPTSKELREKPINRISARTLNYVKLHGSFGWLSSKGTNCYVIGRKKELQIADEPLLAWYFELFKEILSKPDRKLLVIGYRFSDPHVNSVIASSVKHSKLKLYVISPSAQSDFINNLRIIEQGAVILEGLSGYFPYSLLDIFPSDQSKSHAWREIVECYFRNK